MNQSADTAPSTVRFSEAVRAFTPVCASRYAKLLPFKEGIVELRQKGASYRLIRELLDTAGVSVAVDTIGKFVREVLEQRLPARPNGRRRPSRPLATPQADRRLRTPDNSQFPFTVAPPVEPPPAEPPPSVAAHPSAVGSIAERPRTRGPRIANPATL